MYTREQPSVTGCQSVKEKKKDDGAEQHQEPLSPGPLPLQPLHIVLNELQKDLELL